MRISIGAWKCEHDPSFIDELKSMSVHDPETELRRVAKKALQRIIGFWLFYGEWLALSKSPEKHLATVLFLKEHNLGCFAHELTESFRDPETGYVLEREKISEIAEELEQFKLNSEWDSWGGMGQAQYRLEVRYQTNKNVLSDYINWNFSFKSSSLILLLAYFRISKLSK